MIKVKKLRMAWGLAFCVSFLDGHGGCMLFCIRLYVWLTLYPSGISFMGIFVARRAFSWQ